MPGAAWLGLASIPFAVLFISAGRGHFVQPRKFIGIMRGLPLVALHPAANYVTGCLELVLGVALPVASIAGSPARAAAVARALFWLVVIMSPANINMWWNDVPFGRQRLTYGLTGTHSLRFLLQVVLLLSLHGLERAWIAQI